MSYNQIEKAILDKINQDPGYATTSDPLIIETINLKYPFLGSLGHSAIYKIKLIINNVIVSVAVKFSERDEYENLVYLWQIYNKNQTKNRVPEPFFYSKKYKLMFFEFVKGTNLKRLVFMSTVMFSQKNDYNLLRENIFDSVDWLTDFEEKVFSNNYININDHYTEITKYIESSTVFNNKLKSYLNGKFELLCKDIDRIPIKFSNKGFRMRDIISDGECIIRLDWGYWQQKKEHLIFIELSTFLMELREMCILPYINKSKIRNIEESFIDRYWNQTIFSNYKNLYSLCEFSYLIIYLNNLLNKLKYKEKRIINKIFIKNRIKLIRRRIIDLKLHI